MVAKKTKKLKSFKKERKNYIKFCPKCNSIDIAQDKSTMQSLGYLPTKYICNNCSYSSFNFPEIDIKELDKLHLPESQKAKEKTGSELIDTSYGRFYVRVVWKFLGPAFLVFWMVYFYFILKMDSYGSLSLLLSAVFIILGIFMCYFAYKQPINKNK